MRSERKREKEKEKKEEKERQREKERERKKERKKEPKKERKKKEKRKKEKASKREREFVSAVLCRKDTVSPRSCIKPVFFLTAKLGKKKEKNIGDEDKTTAKFFQCFWKPPPHL